MLSLLGLIVYMDGHPGRLLNFEIQYQMMRLLIIKKRKKNQLVGALKLQALGGEKNPS
jgi:hypothetical protein